MENSAGITFKAIDGIKGFDYPIACLDTCIVPNRRRIITLGIYKPSVKVFELAGMTLKYERHFVTDPLKVVSLTEDGEKFIVLRNDKTMECHSRSGLHEIIGAPYQPKDILFNPWSAEVYASGNYGSIYRFNLEQGRFLREMDVAGVRAMSLSSKSGLLYGISEQKVHFVDTRTKQEVLQRPGDGEELLCIDTDGSGVGYAVGTAGGDVLHYDIRSESVVHKNTVDESYIKKIKYSGKHIFCAANRLVNVYSGDTLVKSLDLGFEVNSFDVNEGLLTVGGESEGIKLYFSTELGPVPGWCSSILFG